MRNKSPTSLLIILIEGLLISSAQAANYKMSGRIRMDLIDQFKNVEEIQVPTFTEATRDWTEENRSENMVTAFQHYLQSHAEILRAFLGRCDPSSYKVESPSLYYKDIPPDILKRNTNLTNQQIKCFPRTGSRGKGMVSLLNKYSKWCKEYKLMVGYYKTVFERPGSSWIRALSTDRIKVMSCRTQLQYHQNFLEVLIGRHFIRSKYEELTRNAIEANRKIAQKGKLLQKIRTDFIDANITESEAENKMTNCMKELYDHIEEVVTAFDKLYVFADPPDATISKDDGFHMNVDPSLAEMIHNNVRQVQKVVAKISTIKFLGGEATNLQIINKKKYDEIITGLAQFNGSRFNTKIGVEEVFGDEEDDGPSPGQAGWVPANWMDIHTNAHLITELKDFVSVEDSSFRPITVLAKDIWFNRLDSYPRWGTEEDSKSPSLEESSDSEIEFDGGDGKDGQDGRDDGDDGGENDGHQEERGRNVARKNDNKEKNDNEKKREESAGRSSGRSSAGSSFNASLTGDDNIQLESHLEYGNRILVNMRQRIKEKKSRAVMSNCEKQITECLGVLGKAQTKLIGVGSKGQWQRFNDLYSQLNEQFELSLQ